MKKIQELFVKYKEIIMYLIFGVGTTVVNWGIYTVIVMLGKEVNLTIANIIAWVGAVAFAYITNKLWVFESKSWSLEVVWKELGMFLGARIFSGIFEIGLFPVLVWLGMNQAIFGVEGMLAKVIISVLVVVLNYIFSKLLVFKKKEA
ncbi:MAG: GtrA family protein [Lachnospiraceae bacterium]|nr:GtrA family protein [Lachnospiraceae bacterium]